MKLSQYLKSTVMTGGMIAALVLGSSAQANSLVRVNTTYGSFTIELFDSETPDTVSNFLGYVDRGDYSRSVFHRSEPNFVVQSGLFRWQRDCATGMDPATCSVTRIDRADIVRNEPGISNTEGTVAMAKMAGRPDSASSEWFVNVADNSENLDEQNGGFTAFGRVLGDGLVVVKAINELRRVPLQPGDAPAAAVPVRDFTGNVNLGQFPVEANLILMYMNRVDRFSSAVNVFEYRYGELTTSVDAGDLGNLSVNMRLVSDGPQVIFELIPESVILLANPPEGIGSFNAEEGVVVLPAVELNDNGQVSQINNVVLRLIDGEQMRFVLESFEG